MGRLLRVTYRPWQLALTPVSDTAYRPHMIDEEVASVGYSLASRTAEGELALAALGFRV